MRILRKLSYVTAKNLAKELNENHVKMREYNFAFQIIYGSIVKISLLVVFGIVLNVLKEILLVAATFAIIRINAGGFHMKTYIRCMLVTAALIVPGAIISKELPIIMHGFNMVLSQVFANMCMAIMVFYAPRDCANKRITDIEQIHKFKIISLITIFIFQIGFIILMRFNRADLVIPIMVGMIIESLTLLPIIYKLADGLDKIMDLLEID